MEINNIKILSKQDRVMIKYKDIVIKEYLNNKSLTEISKKYHIAPNTIKNILISENVEILNSDQMSSIKNNERRRENRKYQVNFDYFKTWSHNMAYILGLIYSDGNVCKGRLKIALKSTDIKLLKKIKEEMQYEGEIHIRNAKCKGKNFESAVLCISSIDICEDLYKLGVMENKSLKIEFPNVSEEYFMDFIRGFFDGDGSIEIKKDTKSYQLRTRFCSGSEKFLMQIMNELKRYGFKNKNVYNKKDSKCCEIAYSTNESLLLYNLMYSENCICLDRKFNKFKEGIELRRINR